MVGCVATADWCNTGFRNELFNLGYRGEIILDIDISFLNKYMYICF